RVTLGRRAEREAPLPFEAVLQLERRRLDQRDRTARDRRRGRRGGARRRRAGRGRGPAGRACRVRRIAAGIELGAIEEGVLVAIDAYAGPAPGRDTGIGELLPGGGRERSHLGVGEEPLAGAVA